MGADRPTRRARYETRSADQKSRVWDTISRPGEQGTGCDQPTRNHARQRWSRRRGHRPAISLATVHSSPGFDTEPTPSRMQDWSVSPGRPWGLPIGDTSRTVILNIGGHPPVSALQKPRHFVGVSL
ncbi:hypothetical protein OH76DRAFT_1028785 [Lentinus brumalis]|uniref:Uncharacterized protein n=1 Tax=Lentinus brumalis TaxID=2498619 RepID=A0A371CXT0_9APHY|nr:hypothetical protein OH76DRAFT_1028785 [Polyporus brumalis]